MRAFTSMLATAHGTLLFAKTLSAQPTSRILADTASVHSSSEHAVPGYPVDFDARTLVAEEYHVQDPLYPKLPEFISTRADVVWRSHDLKKGELSFEGTFKDIAARRFQGPDFTYALTWKMGHEDGEVIEWPEGTLTIHTPEYKRSWGEVAVHLRAKPINRDAEDSGTENTDLPIIIFDEHYISKVRWGGPDIDLIAFIEKEKPDWWREAVRGPEGSRKVEIRLSYKEEAWLESNVAWRSILQRLRGVTIDRLHYDRVELIFPKSKEKNDPYMVRFLSAEHLRDEKKIQGWQESEQKIREQQEHEKKIQEWQYYPFRKKLELLLTFKTKDGKPRFSG